MASVVPDTDRDGAGGIASLRLLVVEDEALVAMLIEDALTLHGHHVVGVADTMADALALAEDGAIDLALCDVKLGGSESGIAIARALGDRGVACIFLSGNCPETGDHPRVLGCVPKPFHTAGLGIAVAAAHAVATGRTPQSVPQGMIFY